MTLREEYIALSWCLLERKCAYYQHEPGMPEPPPDAEYDQYERRYLEVAGILGLPTTAHCVGFPSDRPSGRLVRGKLLGTKRFLPWPAQASTMLVKRPVRGEVLLKKRPVKKRPGGFFF